MLKSLIHIVTLLTFVFGTFQFTSIGQYCRAMGKMQASISCACSVTFESDVSISQEEMKCCSIKKFEKDKVQDFVSSMVEISKFVSLIYDVEPILIPSQNSPTVEIFNSSSSPPPKSNLYILNSTLLI